jgi:exonuclease III
MTLKGIKILHNNIRSICNKFEFKLVINELKPDIICLTETWLDNTVTDTEVELNGYKLYRKDRNITNKCGGGLAIYVNKCKLNQF